MKDEINVTEVSTSNVYETSDLKSQARREQLSMGFFPWSNKPNNNYGTSQRKKLFPWKGALYMFGSLVVLACSLIMFQLIDKRPEIETKFLRPAPWLSALISINSILLQAALLEGLSIAWWYNVERYGKTSQGLKALNKTWKQGTSFFAVIRSWKAFNYVALATVFVATIPIEGFLLQSSISQYTDQKLNHTKLYLPVVSSLPFGFSAAVDDGTIQATYDFMSVLQGMDGQAKYPAGIFATAALRHFDWIGCDNRNHTGVCKTNVTIPGFNMSCTTSVEPYDMRPEQHKNQTSFSERVFSSGIMFNLSKPNIIGLEILYKPNQTCKGDFYRKSCELRVAKMSLPVQVTSDQTFYAGTDLDTSDAAYALLSVDANAEATNITYVGHIQEYSGEGNSSSTYGAVAQWLQRKFNGTIDWTYDGRSWSNSATNLGQSYRIKPCHYSVINNTAYGLDIQDFHPRRDNSTWCENVYDGLDWVAETYYYDNCSMAIPVDIAQEVFLAANNVMLGASVTAATLKWNNLSYTADGIYANETVLAKTWRELWPSQMAAQTQPGLHYHIRYGFYGGSVAVTLVVMLMILPLYYGYWHLDEIKTLEPIDTAMVFRGQKSTTSYNDIEALQNEKARAGVTVTQAEPPSPAHTSHQQVTTSEHS